MGGRHVMVRDCLLQQRWRRRRQQLRQSRKQLPQLEVQEQKCLVDHRSHLQVENHVTMPGSGLLVAARRLSQLFLRPTVAAVPKLITCSERGANKLYCNLAAAAVVRSMRPVQSAGDGGNCKTCSGNEGCGCCSDSVDKSADVMLRSALIDPSLFRSSSCSDSGAEVSPLRRGTEGASGSEEETAPPVAHRVGV